MEQNNLSNLMQTVWTVQQNKIKREKESQDRESLRQRLSEQASIEQSTAVLFAEVMSQIDAHKEKDVIIFDISLNYLPVMRLTVLRQIVTTFAETMNIYSLLNDNKWGMRQYLYKKIGPELTSYPAFGTVECSRFAMEFKEVTSTKFNSNGQMKINVIESFL